MMLFVPGKFHVMPGLVPGMTTKPLRVH